MRFLHTSDWHLGRLFHGVHLTEDQAYVLEQLVVLAKEAKVDAVLVAGDIYDRAVPPAEAVELLKAEFEPKGIQVFPISAVSGQGLKELLYHVSGLLDQADDKPVSPDPAGHKLRIEQL